MRQLIKKGTKVKVNFGFYKNKTGYVILVSDGEEAAQVKMEDGLITWFDKSWLSVSK